MNFFHKAPEFPNEIYNHLKYYQLLVEKIDDDFEFQEIVAEKYENETIRFQNSVCLFLENPPCEIKAGTKLRLYGRGMGYSVRGISILNENDEWVVARYQTPKQEVESSWIQSQKRLEENKKRAELERESRDKRIANLPEPLQKRMAYFHKVENNFAAEGEEYELYIYEQAALFVKIADAAGMSIEDFNELDMDQKGKLIIEHDSQENFEKMQGHSGNTYGCAMRIARILKENPESLIPSEKILEIREKVKAAIEKVQALSKNVFTNSES